MATAVTRVCLAKPQTSSVAVAGYAFQQYAESVKQPLQNVAERVLRMARTAGFINLELSDAFLAADMRGTTFSAMKSLGLLLPSLYVGGSMHEREGADRTISKAVEYGALGLPFGCKAIVNNPDPKRGGALKTDAELNFQADSLNRMGRTLAQRGLALRIHHHTPQLVEKAREWRHILHHTDPEYVHICVDVDWAYEGGFQPLLFVEEVGSRLQELHVRSARNKVWLEDLEDSDIDYRAIAGYLGKQKLAPLIVVELAYRLETLVTRSLEEDLRRSRVYAEKIFGVKADS